MRSLLARIAAASLVVVAFAELTARVAFGLGDPVLYAADPAVEYLLRPDQNVRRFGRQIIVNQYGMRSESFPERKHRTEELRILVMGDSVVNGGNRTDHSRLATTLLRDSLQNVNGRPVVVGNVSAGSWGPPNLLAWSHKYGLLDADVVVIVLSSHDASDVPTFSVLNAVTQPTERPVSALWEGVTNYLPRLFATRVADGASQEMHSHLRAPDLVALDAFRQLVEVARNAGACVSVVQHLTQAELEHSPGPGHEAVRVAAAELDVPVSDDITSKVEVTNSAEPIYRDNIHFTDAGQELLARALVAAVEQQCQIRRSVK